MIKKIFLIFLGVFMFQLNAKNQRKICLNFGVDNILPIRKFNTYYSYGIGLNTNLNVKIYEKIHSYISFEYLKYFFNTKKIGLSGSETFIPIKLGAQYFINSNFYLLVGVGINLDIAYVVTPYKIIEMGIGEKIKKKYVFELKYSKTGKYDFTPKILSLSFAYQINN